MKKGLDGKRLCSDCNPNSMRRSLFDANRDEMKVNVYLCKRYDSAYPIGTYAPFRACGDTKRPDSVVVVRDMMFIIETDENGHVSYQINCEWAKALQHGQSALQTETIRRVCFIRLNSSAWRVNGQLQQCKLANRLECLGELIDKQVLEQTETYEMYKLFYPSQSQDDKCVQVTTAELQKWFEELAIID